MTYTPRLGTISHGTLRNEDLLSAFAHELRLCANGHPGNLTLADEADAVTDFDSKAAQDLVDDLFNILNEYAPKGTYFGAHEGDGSDFGFWPIEDETA